MIGGWFSRSRARQAAEFFLRADAMNEARAQAAIRLLARAVALEPGEPRYSAYERAARPLDALESLQAAIRLDPALAAGHESLGICLANMGEAASSIAQFRRALELDSSAHTAYSNMLLALNYVAGEPPEAIFREHLGWARRYGPPAQGLGHSNKADPERKLKVGYVSPDFRNHTIAHRHVASRGGASILGVLGLTELIAETEDECVAISISLARDWERLERWRRELRARLERSPLMDAGQFTRDLEDAYREMWRRWCSTLNDGRPDHAPSAA